MHRFLPHALFFSFLAMPALAQEVLDGGPPDPEGGGQPTDLLPPAAPAWIGCDLALTHSLRVQWYGTGDDGSVGRSTEYDLRIASAPIVTPGDFESATPINVPAPTTDAAGQEPPLTIDGLLPGTLYHLAIRARDEAPGHWGPFSPLDASTLPLPSTLVTRVEVVSTDENSAFVHYFYPVISGTFMKDFRVSPRPILTREDFEAATPVLARIYDPRRDPDDPSMEMDLYRLVDLQPGTPYHLAVGFRYYYEEELPCALTAGVSFSTAGIAQPSGNEKGSAASSLGCSARMMPGALLALMALVGLLRRP